MKALVLTLALFICVPLMAATTKTTTKTTTTKAKSAATIGLQHRIQSWQKVRIRSGSSGSFTAKGTAAQEEAEKLQHFISRVKSQRSAGEIIPYVMVIDCDMECRKGAGYRQNTPSEFTYDPDKIIICPQFLNATPWTVTGVKYTIMFIDSFGDIVHQEDIKDIMVIDPWAVKASNCLRLVFENDRVNKDDLYDKMLQGVNSRTIMPWISITKVAWSSRQVTSNIPPNPNLKPASKIGAGDPFADEHLLGGEMFEVPETPEEIEETTTAETPKASTETPKTETGDNKQ